MKYIFIILVCIIGICIIHTLIEKYSIIPRLPVLTPHNRNQYIDWHKYYEQVYNKKIEHETDLNLFSFFYNFAPYRPIIKIVSGIPIIDKLFRPKTKLNSAWTGIWSSPESKLSQIGYMIYRPIAALHTNVLEVARIDFTTHMFLPSEKYVAWFWIVRGSGIFIHFKDFPVDGKHIIVPSRKHLENWKGDISNKAAHEYMVERNISSIIILNGFDPPRTELLVCLNDQNSDWLRKVTLVK